MVGCMLEAIAPRKAQLAIAHAIGPADRTAVFLQPADVYLRAQVCILWRYYTFAPR